MRIVCHTPPVLVREALHLSVSLANKMAAISNIPQGAAHFALAPCTDLYELSLRMVDPEDPLSIALHALVDTGHAVLESEGNTMAAVKSVDAQINEIEAQLDSVGRLSDPDTSDRLGLTIVAETNPSEFADLDDSHTVGLVANWRLHTVSFGRVNQDYAMAQDALLPDCIHFTLDRHVDTLSLSRVMLDTDGAIYHMIDCILGKLVSGGAEMGPQILPLIMSLQFVLMRSPTVDSPGSDEYLRSLSFRPDDVNGGYKIGYGLDSPPRPVRPDSPEIPF